MDKPVEQFEHAGFRISIYQDYDSDWTPEEAGVDSLFLVAEHRNFNVEHKSHGKPDRSLKSPCDALARYECDEEHEHNASCQREGRLHPAIAHDYWAFLLHAYIHSGVSLTLGGLFEDREPDRRWESRFDPGGWDSSTLGLVFVSRKEWPKYADAEGAAESLVKEWNDVLSGNVYGYVIEKSMRYRKEVFNKDGSIALKREGTQWDNVESCGGFIGDMSHCAKAAKSMAESLRNKE